MKDNAGGEAEIDRNSGMSRPQARADRKHAVGRRELFRVMGPTAAVAGAVLRCGAAQVPATALTTDDRIALALLHFKTGYHCSQSVLTAYAEETGIGEELALRLAAALAGGSTVGGECGAVGAGYLVLGLKHARLEPAYGDVDREQALFGRIRTLVAEFRKKHGSINCAELLGSDVCTPEGRAKASAAGLFQKRCPHYIRDAITILDALG